MPQVQLTLTDFQYDCLQQLSEITGRSMSAIAAHYTNDGIYKEFENLNKLEVYRSMQRKKLSTPQK